mgnify:FL=1
MTDIFNINVRNFLRTAIGFQSAFEAFEYGPFSDELNHSFPHYNIRSINNNTDVIEIALAGYDVSELDVVDDGGSVTIIGGSFLKPETVRDGKTNELKESVYGTDDKKVKKFENKIKRNEVQAIHQGVSKKGFQRQFMLNNGCKVSEATFKNGMLTVKIVDETKSEETKKIKIRT